MIIYIDVLLALNLYINYFLIRSAALLLRAKPSPKRCLLAAAIGAASSLVILIPDLPVVAALLIKAATGVAMVLTAFGIGSKYDVVLRVLVMLSVSFIFSGLMLALCSFVAPLGMVCSNGITYFDIPISAVAVLTIIAYCVIKVIRRFTDKKISSSDISEVTIRCGDIAAKLKGFPDTGNGLCDPFSGRPVIICTAATIETILPDNVRLYLSGELADDIGIRLVPCNTVTSEGLIPIFNADSVLIKGKNADAVIGVSKCGFRTDIDCIFDPKILT